MNNNISRRFLFASVAVVAGAAAFASSAQAQEIFIERAPPPPRVEVIPVIPGERMEREHWQPGFWRWDGHELSGSRVATSSGPAAARCGCRRAGSNVRAAGSLSKATGPKARA